MKGRTRASVNLKPTTALGATTCPTKLPLLGEVV